MYMAGRLRTPSRPLRTWMFRASYEWPSFWPVDEVADEPFSGRSFGSGGWANVRASSRFGLNGFLLETHRDQPDGRELGGVRKPPVQRLQDPLAEHRQMAHPHGSLDFHQKLAVPYADGPGPSFHIGAHDRTPFVRGARGLEAGLQLETREQLVQNPADGPELSFAGLSGLSLFHAAPAPAPARAASDSIGSSVMRAGRLGSARPPVT